MRYITITTWETSDEADYDVSVRRIKEKRLPALKYGAVVSDPFKAAILYLPPPADLHYGTFHRPVDQSAL